MNQPSIVFNIFCYLMFHPEVLTEIITLVGTKEKTDQIFNFSKKNFDLHQFNIGGLYPKDVRKMNESLKRRYKKLEIQILPTNWNEGQRRLFIWFIICFLHLKKVFLEDITQEDLQSLSPIFYGKDPIFLDFQLKNLPKITKSKRHWTSEEDELLKSAIKQLKGQTEDSKLFNNWNDVAKVIFFQTEREIFKTPKSCRQRWYNHVDQSKKKDQFSVEEDLILINYILAQSKSWSKIVKILNYSRTEHRIKNRYYTLIRKYQRSQGAPEELNDQQQKQILLKLRVIFEEALQKKTLPVQIPLNNVQKLETSMKMENQQQNYDNFEEKLSKNEQKIQDKNLKTESNGVQESYLIKSEILQQDLSQKSQNHSTFGKESSKGTIVQGDQTSLIVQSSNFWAEQYMNEWNFYTTMNMMYNGSVQNSQQMTVQPQIVINQYYCPVIVQSGSDYQFFYQN